MNSNALTLPWVIPSVYLERDSLSRLRLRLTRGARARGRRRAPSGGDPARARGRDDRRSDDGQSDPAEAASSYFPRNRRGSQPATCNTMTAAFVSASIILAAAAPPGYPAGAVLNYSMGWVGNTYSGGVCNDTGLSGAACHVRANAQWIFIDPATGNAYGNTVWDESSPAIAQVVAANSSILGAPPAEAFGRPGNNNAGVAATEDFIYLALSGNSGAAQDHNVSGVFRFHNNVSTWTGDIDSPSAASWAGGTGAAKNCLNFTSGLADPKNSYDPMDFAVTGLGVCDGTLLVANNLTGMVLTYDAQSMAPKSSWPCIPHTGEYDPAQHACGPVTFACGDDGSVHGLVGIQIPSRVQLYKWDSSGKVLFNQRRWVAAERIAWDNTSGCLLLVDNDKSAMNIELYESAGTTFNLVTKFGVQGGIFSWEDGGPGHMGPFKFYGINGMGMDFNGSITLNNGMNSHTDLRRFVLPKNWTAVACNNTVTRDCRPTKPAHWISAIAGYSLDWQLVNNVFQQVADISRINESHVFTKDTRYDVNWKLPMDVPKNGFWNLAAVTRDPFAYPDDPRNCEQDFTSGMKRACVSYSTAWSRRLFDQSTQQGRNILFMIGGSGDFLGVYRMEGEIAVPCMLQV